MLFLVIICVIIFFTLLTVEANLKKIHKQNDEVIALLKEIKNK
ncbi:hypothetical protein [Ornithinibacillus sp. 179-J 7C1 HS]